MASLARSNRRNRSLAPRGTSRWELSKLPLGVEHLEARELLNAGPTAPSPDMAQFVTSLYTNLLHRSPAANEVAGWVTVLNTGTSVHDVAQSFTNSLEYRVDVITRDYQTFLGRLPSPMETQIWLSQAQAGFDEKQLQAGLLASQEYYAAHGETPGGWLNGLYSDLFNRTPDTVGLTAWGQELQQGFSRQTVALGILGSLEENTHIVTAAYRGMLARTPDASGLATFVVALANGMTPDQLTNELAVSSEYFGRSSQTVALNTQSALDSLNSSTNSPAHGSNHLKANAGAGQTVNEGTAVTFAGSTSGETAPFSYTWSFGDGGSAVGTLTPTHTYTAAGNYTATLTVTDAQGQSTQSSAAITVANVAPTPIIGGPYAGMVGAAISFAGSATDPNPLDTFTYSWSFGDGSISALQDPNHTYAAPGAYAVTLTITDAGGASATAATTATVDTVAPPIASAGPNQTINEGATVHFAGSATGSGTLSYAWNFGDGSTASGTLTPTHVYTIYGAYTATLTVGDSSGQTAQDSMVITVNNVAPTPNTGGPYTGVAGKAISFAGSATDPSPSDKFTYAWNFGDGSASTLQNPSHTYTASGTYTLTLTVSDQGNAAASATTTAMVNAPSAPTANAGPNLTINEGATASFSGTATGSGALTYSWDFGDGSTAAGVLTPNHLYATFGSYTATLTVTDASGQTAKDTATVTVNNVAPTVSIAAPTASVAGASINFAATVKDPSPVDTFAYQWSFGDGATSSSQNPTHAFSTAGTYTVTLTVVDQGGASTSASAPITVTAATPTSVIRTPFDTIPDFGAHPTIVSVASGNWSDPRTWSLGRLPTTGDIVDIERGTTVTYDVMSSDQLNTVEVLAGGQLHWQPDINTEIVVGNFLILPGGDLEVGTVAAPIASNVMANIIIADQAINTAIDPSQFGTGIIGLGTVHMAGAAKTPFVTLAAELHAGAMTLTLSQTPTGWLPGDQLFLPDTQQFYSAPGNGLVPKWEMATIASINGTTVTLSSPLSFNHLGARNADGTLRFLPQVVNLSRNVMIASQNPEGTRGYVMFTGRADVDIRYIGFCELGRTTVNPLDNTTFDALGNVTHIGTNQVDRYPMYFRHLDGPAQVPADGYQFTAIGDEIDNGGSAAPLQKWGLVVHDSNYGLISGNVIQNVGGAAFVTQDGSESYNVFDGNFSAVVSAPGKADESDLPPGNNPGRDGAGYWFRGHNNYVRNNIATDSALGFQYMSYRRGLISVPLFQGADSSNPTQMQTVNLATLPILQFQGDQAYGAMRTGLDIWEIGSLGEVLYAVPDSFVRDFSAWNFYSFGITIYRTHDIVFDDVVMRGNIAQDGHSIGFNFSSPYRLRDHTVTNSDIQGLGTGVLIDMPVVGGMQTGNICKTPLPQTMTGDITIANSFFACYTGIEVKTDRWSGSQSAPRLTLIENVRFAGVNWTISGLAQQFIAMVYAPGKDMTGAADLIEQDQVQVVNFDGVSGDNFEVYYLQQDPNFVIPVSDPTQGLVASPVAGLTNLQAWAQYGIAVAGGVAPTTNTRAGILGYV